MEEDNVYRTQMWLTLSAVVTKQIIFPTVVYFWFYLLLKQGSNAMSQILVQRLGALAHISPFLKSLNPSLQKTTVLLLGNMSRNSNVQTAMGK